MGSQSIVLAKAQHSRKHSAEAEGLVQMPLVEVEVPLKTLLSAAVEAAAVVAHDQDPKPRFCQRSPGSLLAAAEVVVVQAEAEHAQVMVLLVVLL